MFRGFRCEPGDPEESIKRIVQQTKSQENLAQKVSNLLSTTHTCSIRVYVYKYFQMLRPPSTLPEDAMKIRVARRNFIVAGDPLANFTWA